MNDGQIHFARLSESERSRVVKHLMENRFPIVLWVRGDKEKRVIVEVNYYLGEFEEVVFTFKETDFDYDQKNVLIHFSMKSMNFFGTAKVSVPQNGPEGILTLGEFFLTERRSSFRLKIDSSHKVICFISKEESAGNDARPSFKVGDISQGGLSFIIKDTKRRSFIKDKMIHSMELIFDDSSLVIPKAKVVRVVPERSSEEGEGNQLKVQVQFFDVPSHVDNELGRLINKYIRKNDAIQAFENFLT